MTRIIRWVGFAAITLSLVLGLAMILDLPGFMDFSGGNNDVAIWATMGLLVLGAVVYRVHPPWVSFFVKVASIVGLLATRIHSMVFRLLHYLMAVHMPSWASPDTMGADRNASTAIHYTRYARRTRSMPSRASPMHALYTWQSRLGAHLAVSTDSLRI